MCIKIAVELVVVAMVRWMCSVKLKDRLPSKELRAEKETTYRCR